VPVGTQVEPAQALNRYLNVMLNKAKQPRSGPDKSPQRQGHYSRTLSNVAQGHIAKEMTT
jgi:hypothetical protein